MNILALNTGSSTLKYKLIALEDGAGPSDGSGRGRERVLAESSVRRESGDSTARAVEEVAAKCRPLR